MGLLDVFNSYEGQQALGLLAAAGPRSDGAGFGQRLQEGLGYADKWQKTQTEKKRMEMADQLGQLQLDAEKLKYRDAAKARAVMMGYGLPTQSTQQPSADIMGTLPREFQTPVNAAMPGAQLQTAGAGGGTGAGAGTQKSDFFTHYMGLAEQYRQAGLPEQYQGALAQAEKFRPKYSTTPQQMMVGGKLQNVMLSEDGGIKTLNDYGVKPDMVEQTDGATKTWVDKNAVQPGQRLTLQQSPDSKASNAITIRGQNMLDARKKEELQGAEDAFTPGAIANAASRYNLDGTLPPMGMGKSASMGRSAILNKAAELAAGVSGEDQRAAQLGFKANSAALAKLQQQQTMVSSFEKNANLNADMALALSGQVSRTGSPLVNTWLQAGQKSIAGDEKLAQFHAATETFVNEYAKIMSGSMGNTAVSDAARSHAHSILGTAQNQQTYAAVIKTLKAEMANRMAGMDEEKKGLVESMRTPKAQAASGSYSTYTQQDLAHTALKHGMTVDQVKQKLGVQ
jgi:hypothetical protein